MKKIKGIIDLLFIVLIISVIILYIIYIYAGRLVWVPGILLIVGLIMNWYLIRKAFNKK